MSRHQPTGPVPATAAASVSRPPDTRVAASTTTARHLDSAALGQPSLGKPAAEMLVLLQRLAVGVETLHNEVRRVADHLSPEPCDVVGTPYIAKRLACTTVWVTDMARNGQIPKNCIVPGTGSGKPWKFYRRGIDEWLGKR